MKKLISTLSALALTVASVGILSAPPKTEASEGIKIMCVGDSITDGYVYDYVGSYRKYLYYGLTNAGYTIDMVGAKDDYTASTNDIGLSFEFDNANTGYSGYSIVSYGGRTGIYETLQSTNCLSQSPDIVTLQIGTNDIIDNYEIASAGERLEILVDYILDNISDSSALFVTTIPNVEPNRSDVYSWFGNYRHSPDWQTQYNDEQAEQGVKDAISSYNSQIYDLVEKKKAEGENIYFADIGSTISDTSTMLFDGVHPNNTGYYAMGSRWAEILGEYLGGKSELPTAPEIPTEPPTTTEAPTEPPTTTEAPTEPPTTTEAPTEPPTTTEAPTEPPTTTEAPTEPPTTTEIPTEPPTTTETPTEAPTEPEVPDETFLVSDLVKLSRYLLGYTAGDDTFTYEDIQKYDLDESGKVDVFDLVIGRQLLCGISHIK